MPISFFSFGEVSTIILLSKLYFVLDFILSSCSLSSFVPCSYFGTLRIFGHTYYCFLRYEHITYCSFSLIPQIHYIAQFCL